MKVLVTVLTLSFSIYGFASQMDDGDVGQKLGNNLNTCVGCALRAAQIDQRNREAGKAFEEKKEQQKRENGSSVKSY